MSKEASIADDMEKDTLTSTPHLTSGQESQDDHGIQLSTFRLVLLGGAMLVAYAVGTAGILETSFALPIIQRELGVSSGDVQWVSSSFILSWLIAGRLCDIFGRKRGLLLGLGGHAACNLAATFMPNLAGLNVFRALTGLCLAILYPAAAGIIGTVYPAGRPRTLAFVAVTCGGAGGAAGGELFAGIFIEYLRWTWRACYFSIAIMSVVPIPICYVLVPADPTLVALKAIRLVDWFGALTLGSSLFLVLLTLTIAQTSARGWRVSYLPALLVVSAILFVIFVLRQRQLSRAAIRQDNTKPPPLIPSTLLTWKNRNIIAIYIAAFFCWASTDTVFVGISYLYFDVLKFGAFEAGLKLSVTFFSGTIAAVVVALTISRIPPRLLICLCCWISLVTPILFAVRDLDWAYWKSDLWAFLLVAYGTDAIIAAGSTIISQTASPEDQSVASAIFQTSCRLGFVVGLAIATLIRDTVQNSAERAYDIPVEQINPDQKQAAELKGLRAVFWVCTGFIGLSSLIVLLGMHGWDKLDQKDVSLKGVEVGAREVDPVVIMPEEVDIKVIKP